MVNSENSRRIKAMNRTQKEREQAQAVSLDGWTLGDLAAELERRGVRFSLDEWGYLLVGVVQMCATADLFGEVPEGRAPFLCRKRRRASGIWRESREHEHQDIRTLDQVLDLDAEMTPEAVYAMASEMERAALDSREEEIEALKGRLEATQKDLDRVTDDLETHKTIHEQQGLEIVGAIRILKRLGVDEPAQAIRREVRAARRAKRPERQMMMGRPRAESPVYIGWDTLSKEDYAEALRKMPSPERSAALMDKFYDEVFPLHHMALISSPKAAPPITKYSSELESITLHIDDRELGAVIKDSIRPPKNSGQMRDSLNNPNRPGTIPPT